MSDDRHFAALCILDGFEARETANALRVEAERRWEAGDLPAQDLVVWRDAAAWIDGSEEREA